MRPLRSIPAALLIAILALAFGATSAGASPGAYRIIIVQANCEPPTEIQGQLKALPDVAAVDIFDACVGTPTLAELTPYDLVMSINEDGYFDPVAYGNVLADYVDAGGFVFQYAYDSEDSLLPEGRFNDQGYPPFIPGDNPNDLVSLGEFNASSPLMQGVTDADDRLEHRRGTGARGHPGREMVRRPQPHRLQGPGRLRHRLRQQRNRPMERRLRAADGQLDPLGRSPPAHGEQPDRRRHGDQQRRRHRTAARSAPRRSPTARR